MLGRRHLHRAAGGAVVEAIEFFSKRLHTSAPSSLHDGLHRPSLREFDTTPRGFLNFYVVCLLSRGRGWMYRHLQMHLSNVQFFASIVTVLLQLFYLKRTGAQSRWNKAA